MNFARMFAFVASIAAFAVHGGAIGTSLFSHRIPITVSGYDGESTLTNFPVLVKLADNAPTGFAYADCASDGSDLRFADADGNLIPHEIDTWNTAGESLVWVGIPVLTNNASFTMYYGADSPGAASTVNLWSLAGYAGVWHMTDGHDSSSSGLNGTLVSGISSVTISKLGGALDFNTAKMGVGTTPNSDLANGFSLEAWCYPRRLTDKTGDSSKSGNAFFGKNLAMSVRIQESKIRLTTPSVKDHDLASCSIVANAWFHLGLTFLPNTATTGTGTTENQLKIYKDGNQKASLGASRIPNLGDSAEMWIGGNQWPDQAFEGILDEFRLSYSIRSADWVKAAYDTAADPVAFAHFGKVELTDPSAPSLGALSVVAENGAFVISTSVAKNFPAFIVCTVGGTEYPMTTLDASLPATYSATISGLPSGTYTAAVQATATSGTVVSSPVSDAFHSGALTVTKVSDADEMTLARGVFRVSRADADSTGLPALTFGVAFSGDGLAAVVAPGIDSATIPAGASSVDISITPVFTMGVNQDADLVLTVSGENIGEASSETLTVLNSSINPSVLYVATTGDDANDGLSVLTAKATIASALAALKALPEGYDERTVYVCDGDYAFDSGEEIATMVDFPVLVTSLSGDASKVRITRTGYSKRIFQIDCADAVVSHLTLYGGNSEQGGATYITANGGTLLDCVVSNCANSTWNSHGAVYVNAGRVARCLFRENGYKVGSGLYAKAGVVESCLFTGNNCGAAGAACLEGSASLVNCTIVANTGSSCSGVRMNNNKGKVVNCAIFGNTAPDSATGKVFDSNGACFLSCAADLEIPDGTGCLCVEPSFRDAEHGDWRLSPASPLIDAGIDAATYGATSAKDFDGSARVVPVSVDIGCYENSKSDVECGFVYTCAGYLIPTEIEFTGVVFGFAETPDFTWDVTNTGTEETEHLSGASPTWTASEPGVYSVRLTVSGTEGSASYEMASCIKLAPADMYTSPGNESAAYPYSTPETAAPSIATAVAAAVDGTTIHVLKGADGIYPQSATIKVEKGVRIIGETGNPNDIVCTNLVVNVDKHGIFLLNHPDAFLAGLTLANGSLKANYSDGACLRIKPSGGTVSNCVICSGQSQHFDSQGAGAYVQAGIVTHTRFTGRFTSCPAYNANPTSKGVVAHLTGGRLENCLFHDIEIAPTTASEGRSCGPVVSVTGGTMLNCTVVGRCQCIGTGSSTDGNFTKFDGGSGIYCGSSGWVKNCVSTCVTNMNGVVTPFSGNALRFVNCAGDGGVVWGGTDCIDGMPESFFNDFEGRDYTPRFEGPLENAGVEYDGMATVDLVGKNRKVGKYIDIGCYECQTENGFYIHLR